MSTSNNANDITTTPDLYLHGQEAAINTNAHTEAAVEIHSENQYNHDTNQFFPDDYDDVVYLGSEGNLSRIPNNAAAAAAATTNGNGNENTTRTPISGDKKRLRHTRSLQGAAHYGNGQKEKKVDQVNGNVEVINEIRANPDHPDHPNSKTVPESFNQSDLHLYQHYIVIYNGRQKSSTRDFKSGEDIIEGLHVYIKNRDRYERIDLNDPRFYAWEAQQIRDASRRFLTVVLPEMRRTIECDGKNSFSDETLEDLIERYPKELAFSLLLCATRFPVHSRILMDKIFKAFEDYSEEQMDYCNPKKFRVDEDKDKNAEIVIGEALILLLDSFNGFQATPESGNVEAIELVEQRYPKSILYVDGCGVTPLVKACGIPNMKICQCFIKWHLQEKPQDRGGLYTWLKHSVLPMYDLIDTKQDISPLLEWLHGKGLLESNDVEDWELIHRSAQYSPYETITFLINLCPSGLMSKDYDGNLPIHMHLSNRNSSSDDEDNVITSDEDYVIITKLLITMGIMVGGIGGINTIGGLLHKVPDEGIFRPVRDDESICTLDALLVEKVGEEIYELWDMIDEWVEEATGGNYALAPIIHAVILNWEHISVSLCENIISRYGTKQSNIDGDLPLRFAIRKRGAWDDCVIRIFKKNRYELDESTHFPLLPFAASRENADVSTLYEITRRSPWLFPTIDG